MLADTSGEFTDGFMGGKFHIGKSNTDMNLGIFAEVNNGAKAVV
jgi:hypothetical protein